MPTKAVEARAERAPTRAGRWTACLVGVEMQGNSATDTAMYREVLPLTLLVFFVAFTPVEAASPQEKRGRILALYNCAKCHSIDKVSPSRVRIAPPFRTLHTRYPIEVLANALAQGISTGHPRMPPFPLGPDQVDDLLAYLKTLE